MVHGFEDFKSVTLGYSLKLHNKCSAPDRNSGTLGENFFNA